MQFNWTRPDSPPPKPPTPEASQEEHPASLASLAASERSGERPIQIGPIRHAYRAIHWRRWHQWRELAGIGRRQRKVSKLAALRLWLVAGSGGKLQGNALGVAVVRLLRGNPDKVQKWLDMIGWEGQSPAKQMMAAINGIFPAVDAIHRQRLYEWFKKAVNKPFSVKGDYTYQQVLTVARLALKGAGLGRKRGEGGATAWKPRNERDASGVSDLVGAGRCRN